jgi:hypothetical protein
MSACLLAILVAAFDPDEHAKQVVLQVSIQIGLPDILVAVLVVLALASGVGIGIYLRFFWRKR